MRRTQRSTSIGCGRCAALDDGLQHCVDVLGLDLFHCQLADVGFNVALDPAAHDVGVLPVSKYHPLKVFIRKLPHSQRVLFILDLGKTATRLRSCFSAATS